jgi:sugar/nucleoside kinase (ribokinase family)
MPGHAMDIRFRNDHCAAPTLAIVGGLALDNVITADGAAVAGRPGGNTLWAAAGAAMFDERVGIVARAGDDYPDWVLARFEAAGVDITGVIRTGEPHRLRIAYAHLPDGRRMQPVPPHLLRTLQPSVRAQFVDTTTTASERAGGDPEPTDIPRHWLAAVRGWHVPLVSLSAHRRLLAAISRHDPAWLIADCPNRHEVADWVVDLRRSCRALTAFLPSTSDLDIIDPSGDAAQQARRLSAAAGIPIVLKRGRRGSLIIAPADAERVVPALDVSVLDPTGAGDAFCGGFLAGLNQTGDLGQAAAFGAVAASFAVQTTNPLHVIEASQTDRGQRLRLVLDQTDPL